MWFSVIVIVQLPTSGQATLASNGAWSLPGLHLYTGGLGLGGLPQHTIDDMRLAGWGEVGAAECCLKPPSWARLSWRGSLAAMASSCTLYLHLLVFYCTLVISQHLHDSPDVEKKEQKTAVTPAAAQEKPFVGANRPNLKYCCGPSGYCKPCKDQTRLAGGPINYPVWISQIYGK